MGKVNQLYSDSEAEWLGPNARLWRYVPLQTLFVYLTGYFFIPSIETLRSQDPFEGDFHFDGGWFMTMMGRQYGERVKDVEAWIHRYLLTESERLRLAEDYDYALWQYHLYQERYLSFLRRTRFASCWFHSEGESAAMWNSYGNQGVAIATTVKKLSSILSKTELTFEFGRMRYVKRIDGKVRRSDFNPKSFKDGRFLSKPHYLKRKEYESENEVRFVTAAPERKGILLEGISPKWIDRILLWPGLRVVDQTAIGKAIKHFGPKIRCECSDLFADQRKLGVAAALEPFLNPPLSFETADDNTPSELKRV
jgi:hypothetical protein